MADNNPPVKGTINKLEENNIVITVPNDRDFSNEWRPGTVVYVSVDRQQQQANPTAQQAIVVMMPEQKKPVGPEKKKPSQVFDKL